MSHDPAVELRVDDVVDGRYRICKHLGRGGMGSVYEAQQIKLDRAVALKVLRAEIAGKELAGKRFEREAKAASAVDHRNVVKILDFGQLPTGELYYTMELLRGRDLSQLLREVGPLPWSRAGWILLQLVRAFSAVHDKGIVHRDIKPANCFLLDPKPGDEPDFVKILDFGIANLQAGPQVATALTAASDIIGSVFYMAPEQAMANHVDGRTDVYALGVMMYELLTGVVPFRDANVFQVMLRHQQEAPRPPRELAPAILPEVEAIVLRALAKDPNARFQSMIEVEAALLPLVELAVGASTGAGRRVAAMTPAPAAVTAVEPAADPTLVLHAEPAAASTELGDPGTLLLHAEPTTTSLDVGDPGTLLLHAEPTTTSVTSHISATASLTYATPTATASGYETSPSVAPAGAATVDVSLPFESARPTASPADRRRWWPIAGAFALAIGGVAAMLLWPEPERDGAPAAPTPVANDGSPTPPANGHASGEADPKPVISVAPTPPEQQYDPFADPFGAPPLVDREEPRSALARAGKGTTAASDAAATELAVEAMLPPQPWTLEPGGLSGRILGARGKPVAEAGICAWLVDPQAPADLRRRPKCARTDARGRFTLTEVPPSFYDLSAFARGHLPQSYSKAEGQLLVLRPGQRHEDLELTLETGGVEAHGRIEDSRGKPIPAARVAAVGLVRALGVADGEGEFTLWVAEGDVHLVAWANGYTDVVARGDAGKPLTLVLRREAVLEGRVVDADTGEPISGARVRAGAQGKGAVDPLVYSDARGEFTISALSPGRYAPSARVDDGFGQVDALEVEEGTVAQGVIVKLRRTTKAEPVDAPAVVEPAPAVVEEPPPVEVVTPPVVAEPALPADTKAPPPAVVEPVEKPKTDAMLRKALSAKIATCGDGGEVEVKAKFILENGRLFDVEIVVSGAAAGDPKVKACAEKHAEKVELLRRKQPSMFKPLRVKL